MHADLAFGGPRASQLGVRLAIPREDNRPEQDVIHATRSKSRCLRAPRLTSFDLTFTRVSGSSLTKTTSDSATSLMSGIFLCFDVNPFNPPRLELRHIGALHIARDCSDEGGSIPGNRDPAPQC